MIKPNLLGRSPFPAHASQWMLVGLRGGAAPPPGLNDGDPVTTWLDSSGNGYNASQTGSARPIFKSGILNGKPAVRFTSAGHSGLNLASAINAAAPWTCFVVMKPVSPTSQLFTLASSASTTNFPLGPFNNTDNSTYHGDKSGFAHSNSSQGGAVHVYTTVTPAGLSSLYVDGTTQTVTPSPLVSTGDFDNIGYLGSSALLYSDGDIAEIIFYSGTLAIRAKLLLVLTVLISTGEIPSPDEAEALLAAGDLVALEAYLIEHGVPVEEARDTLEPMAVGDRANIEKYLGAKYGITVAGGTAVDPSTVSGLLGWWKADSLGT